MTSHIICQIMVIVENIIGVEMGVPVFSAEDPGGSTSQTTTSDPQQIVSRMCFLSHVSIMRLQI